MTDTAEYALRGIFHITSAAREVGCHPETLRNFVRRGEIPDRRDSGHRRVFTPADLRVVRRKIRK